jgi:hypothetical protein
VSDVAVFRQEDTHEQKCYDHPVMELAIQIQIEELPEGLFLATSDQLLGLVAQGRTVAEALEDRQGCSAQADRGTA